MKKILITVVTILGLISCFLSVATYAESSTTTGNNSGQALEIAPPVITLEADPGTTLKTQISLRNISSGDLIVGGQINDFSAAGEDGTPKIILDDVTDNPYSMKTWIVPLQEMILKPRQKEDLQVTINIPVDATPGGHYGVIRFTAVAPELKGTGVSLSASLGSLLIVKINGDVKEELSIAEYSIGSGGKPSQIFESIPAATNSPTIEFTERLKNSGNAYEQPVGKIVIKDMFGKEVASPNVNISQNIILSQSIRKFTQPLDKSLLGNKQLFGLYTAELKLTYGADKTVLTSTIRFWVIPYTLIAIIIIALIAGFIGLRISIKRYNRHIEERVLKAHKNKK